MQDLKEALLIVLSFLAVLVIILSVPTIILYIGQKIYLSYGEMPAAIFVGLSIIVLATLIVATLLRKAKSDNY